MSSLPAHCDRPLADSTPARGHAAHPNLVPATSILASSLAFIDGSVVNVGLAPGRRGRRPVVRGERLSPSAELVAAAGRGRRRPLRPAPHPARRHRRVRPGVGAVRLGAALLLPNSLAILGATFTGKARGKAIGIWAAAGAAAGAVGPLLGGWLIDTVGWRAVFYINLPIAALAILLGWRYVNVPPGDKPVALDPPGALLASIGLGCLTWGLAAASADKGVTTASSLAMAAGIVVLLPFLWFERRAGDAAMLRSSSFSGLNLMTFLLYGALGALMLLVPYVLIQALQYSAKQAGAALLPFPVVLAIGSPLMRRVAGSHGSRLPLSIGALIVAGGFLLGTRIGAGSYATHVLPAILVIAAGMACVAAPRTTAATRASRPASTARSRGAAG
jgi:MFS family permease